MKTPEDYRREMMQMYERSRQRTETAAAPSPAPQPEPAPRPQPEPPRPPMPQMPEPQQPVPQPEPVPRPQPEPPRPPMPQMPEPQQPVPQPEPVPGPGESSFGWLKITTRSADSAYPIPEVSVMILRQDGMETHLLYSLLTNESGETPPVRLPAPPIGNPQTQPYSTYLVRAYRPGYARMESDNVPVFPGITSIQQFDMRPLPTGSNGYEPTIINQNPEPTF